MEVKNTRLADWIQKALKEHHSTQKDYQSQTLEGLNKEFSRIQERLDGLYDDKLDKKITQEFYDKKFEQYSKQQDTVLGAIQRLKEANINYYELGTDDLPEHGIIRLGGDHRSARFSRVSWTDMAKESNY